MIKLTKEWALACPRPASKDVDTLKEILRRGEGGQHRPQNAHTDYSVWWLTDFLTSEKRLNFIRNQSPEGVLPLVSVIVPIYNVQEYLFRCIQSVLNQTYFKLEIILVDDGSPDECPALCDAYAEKDVRIRVIHKKNGGLSDARNAGINVATGEYFAFVDSDDWLEFDMVEELLFAAFVFEAPISECGYVNEYTNHQEYTSGSSGAYVSAGNKYALMSAIQWGCFKVNAWNKLYHCSLFQNGDRYPVGKLHEDEFFTHKLVAQCPKLVYSDRLLYHYDRTRETSITQSKFSSRHLDVLEALRNRAAFFLEKEWYGLYAVMLDSYAAQVVQRLEQCEASNICSSRVEQVRNWLSEDRNKICETGPSDHLLVQMDRFIPKQLPPPTAGLDISVIIPVHNAAKTLPAAFFSLKSQTFGFHRLEIIIVENGSRDDSRSIVSEYAANNSNVVPVYINQCAGPGQARNEGLAHVTSSYIMFLDADDEYPSYACALLYGAIHGSNYDVVSGSYSIMDEAGEITTECALGHIGKKETNFCSPGKDVRWDYFRDAFWSKIYRAKLIFFHQIEFLQAGAAEDLYFLYRCIHAATCIKFLPEPTYHYRVANSSFMQSAAVSHYLLIAKNYHRIFQLFIMWGEEPSFKKISDGVLEYHLRRVSLNTSLQTEQVEDVLSSWQWLFYWQDKNNIKLSFCEAVTALEVLSSNFKGSVYQLSCIVSACREIEQLNKNQAQMSQDLTYLLNERERLENETAALNFHVSSIKASRSWKVASFLQKIYNAFFRKRHYKNKGE